jgi:hypothetical protein
MLGTPCKAFVIKGGDGRATAVAGVVQGIGKVKALG